MDTYSAIRPNTFMSAEFGCLRTVEHEGKTLFAGADVTKALGYVNSVSAIKRHCKPSGIYKVNVMLTHKTYGNGGYGEATKVVNATFLTEGNVYRLICKSKLDMAEEFENWVFENVLPAIRKTGGYVEDPEKFVEAYLPQATALTKGTILSMLKAFKSQDMVIEQQQKSVEFANAVGASQTSILIGEFAKILKKSNVNVGPNRLFDWMRRKGYLMKGNVPKQVYLEKGYFEVKESVYFDRNSNPCISVTPMITPKGQKYFTERIVKDFSK